MRIGMDISQIAHRGGVGIYTENLAKGLINFSDLEMVFFYSSLRKPYMGKLKNVKEYRLPPTLFEILFNRWRNVTIEKFLGPMDIFHSSDWIQPPTKALKVTTVHDLVPIKFPQWSHPKVVSVHKRRLRLIEEEIDMVITVSESTKKDLMEVTGIAPEKIKVIYEAPSANFTIQSKDKISRFRRKYNLPDQFTLAIGGIGERRNLQRIKEAAKDYHLVIAGKDIPWLDSGELELLYQSASVLVYCSLYEGFGISILDAFSCGLPVVTSKVSSMPEVGGSAPLYVNPYDIEDIKEKITIIMSDKKLREEMIQKGFKRVKQFSWEKTAQETAILYRGLAGK